MNATPFPVAGLLAISVAAAATAATPALVIEERHAQFGDRYQGSTVEHRYALTNTSDTAVRVVETFVVDGTGELSVTPAVIPPGAGGVAVVRQPLAAQLGRTAFRYALITDEPGVDRYRVTLSGFVQSAYDPETLTIDFGVVDRSTGATTEVELSSREVAALEVLRARGLPGSLEIDVVAPAGPAGQGQLLRAALAKGVPPGLVSGSFVLETNIAHQPELEVFYRANVIGDIVPSENPLQLGVTRIGEVLRKEIRLESKTGRPFEIEQVSDSAALFAWFAERCAEGGESCRRLVLELAPEHPRGLSGKLSVQLTGEGDPITLHYRGIVITAATVIKTIEAPGNPGGTTP